MQPLIEDFNAQLKCKIFLYELSINDAAGQIYSPFALRVVTYSDRVRGIAPVTENLAIDKFDRSTGYTEESIALIKK